ncbi:MAG: sigma 54-interacting transcriptional regulator [Myxococcales bacterium]|nr:sigma 54-interacting transcriptional regulator [Myxococcales bacterium]
MPTSDPPRPSALRALATVPMTEPPEVAVPRLEVVVEREAGAPADQPKLVVEGEVLRVGSNPANEIVLEDPRVRRFHCRFVRERDGYRLEDVGSTNGTFLLLGPESQVRVRDVDLWPAVHRSGLRLQVGDSVLVVRALEPVDRAPISTGGASGALVGQSVVMRRLHALVDRVAKATCTVLVRGESGSGKELVVHEIVQRGARKDQPFVVVDCGAMASNLVESELFGHVKGAFTGADRVRIGAFEAADGGTVFLDEIGELALELQPKLLRVLENGEIRRVGDRKVRKVDVRVVAATHRDLEREVNQGRFREDLYFRLSVVTLPVPPLRERRADVPALVQHFLEQLGHSSSSLFGSAALSELAQHDWPGNVRELRNHVERSIVLESTSLRASDRPKEEAPAVDPHVPFKLAKEALVDAFEREYLEKLLAEVGGNLSAAARQAGIDRMYMHRLVQKHGLRRE